MMYWVALSENELVDLVVLNIVDSLNSMANALESSVRTYTYGQQISD